MPPEILPFELDPHLVHHVIHSQAGSIGKALIELVMNAVDAGSPTFDLTITAQGFTAQDAGQGFASREDIVRYFGRFGTPHQEGDATFGRFRLGRGQIMAHAATRWDSNAWVMHVDTQTMGYAYGLEPARTAQPGCHITGTWYTPLESFDLHAVLQELRDLVRYTPLMVTLNGTRITRDPATEAWDAQDEHAYYRLRREGALAIYNQGVLVRHDPGQVFGVGGLIVTKQALDLNVSRTEILRQTCPVWKAVATRFKALADQILDRDPPNRQTESARARRARDLLTADDTTLPSLLKEKVFTLLPGTQHVSLVDLQHRVGRGQRWTLPDLDVALPRAEMLAQSGLATVFHPRTLERFECYSPEEFQDVFADLWARTCPAYLKDASPTWMPYQVLDEVFVERTEVVPDQQIKDPETRRAWRCLRRALHPYVAHVQRAQGRQRTHLHLLVGQSNAADAWTDGQSYIAIHKKFIDQLGGAGLAAAYTIVTLLDHELAHEGDSLDAVHDEAFYARYHDVSVDCAGARHQAIQRFLALYSSALDQHQGRQRRRGWATRHDYHLKRINQTRSPFEASEAPAPVEEDLDRMALDDTAPVRDAINLALAAQGLQREPVTAADLQAALDVAEARRAAQQAEREAANERWNAEVQIAAAWRQANPEVTQCPAHLDDHVWEEAGYAAFNAEVEQATVWLNTHPQAETCPDHLSPDAWGMAQELREWEQFKADHATEEPDCDPDIEQAEWEAEQAQQAAIDQAQREAWEPRPFAEVVTAAHLTTWHADLGLPAPDAATQTRLTLARDDLGALEVFLRQHRRWPQDATELGTWQYAGQPTLDPGLTMAHLQELAANVGLSVRAYLAWRQTESTS